MTRPEEAPLLVNAAAADHDDEGADASEAAGGGVRRVALVAMLATLPSVAFGYDVGVVSGCLKDMAQTLSLSTFEQECATSGLNFLAGIGALLVSGTALDRLGRRVTLLLAAVLLIMGSAAVASSFTFAQVLAGRALQGLGAGCTIVAASVSMSSRPR